MNCLFCEKQFKSKNPEQLFCSRDCANKIPRNLKHSTCTVVGCEKPHASNGLCGMHQSRKRRHGDTSTTKKIYRNTLDDFWNLVNKTTSCWLWTGKTFHDGYGCFSLKGIWRTHRLSYQLHFGEIPQDLLVCHKCDTPLCVNPDHLFLGTPKDNTQDAIKKNRLACGEKQGKLTNIQAQEIRDISNTPEKPTYKAIAKNYGVCEETIGRIVRKEHYK